MEISETFIESFRAITPIPEFESAYRIVAHGTPLISLVLWYYSPLYFSKLSESVESRYFTFGVNGKLSHRNVIKHLEPLLHEAVVMIT